MSSDVPFFFLILIVCCLFLQNLSSLKNDVSHVCAMIQTSMCPVLPGISSWPSLQPKLGKHLRQTDVQYCAKALCSQRKCIKLFILVVSIDLLKK